MIPSYRYAIGLGLLLGAASLATSACAAPKAEAPPILAPKTAACDRDCLKSLGDQLLDAMLARAPGALPLATQYAATENGVAMAIPMMTSWSSISEVANRFFVIDPVTQQVFFASAVKETGRDAMLFGRFKAQSGALAEVEIYTTRSRGEGGFMLGPREWANTPAVWTQPIAKQRIPSRQDLLVAGKSIFDPAVDGPAPAASCRLMENGRLVAEDPEVLKYLAPPPATGSDGSGHPRTNPDGSVPIPCGAPPERPADPLARTSIVDEVQGIVVSFGMIDGLTQPYLITSPTTSAYVPKSLMKPYDQLLAKQRASGDYDRPAIRPMEASQIVAQVHRIYDGKLQAMQMFQKSAPPGARSPWTE